MQIRKTGKTILIKMLLETVLDRMSRVKIKTKTKEISKKGKEMIIKVIALMDCLVNTLMIDPNHLIIVEI